MVSFSAFNSTFVQMPMIGSLFSGILEQLLADIIPIMANKHKSFFNLQVNFDLGTVFNVQSFITIVKNRCTAPLFYFLRSSAVFFNILKPCQTPLI